MMAQGFIPHTLRPVAVVLSCSCTNEAVVAFIGHKTMKMLLWYTYFSVAELVSELDRIQVI